MQVACLMMQKNEDTLLEPWILYHGAMFGFENLYVYDNGSASSVCRSLLSKYAAFGVNVDISFSNKHDFENKGTLFAEKIKALEALDKYDFYFPLDCDEFIVAEQSEGFVRFDAAAVFDELSAYICDDRPLRIVAAYDNNPVVPGYFYRSDTQRKTFFASDACESLDIGFHDGKTKSGLDSVKTNIAYVHFHYKIFSDYLFSARQKLEGRVVDFSVDVLREHAASKKPGYHLIGALVKSEDEYYLSLYRQYKNKRNVYFNLSFFDEYLARLGVSIFIPTDVCAAYANDTRRWRGYVDFLRIEDGLLVARGWIASAFSENVDAVYIVLNGEVIPSVRVTRHVRQDLLGKVSFLAEKAGFVAYFDASLDVLDGRDLIVYVKENGTTHTLSLSESVRRLNS